MEQARESGGRTPATSNGTAAPGDRSRSGAAALFGTGTRPDSSGLTPEMISAFTTRLQSILQAAEEEAEEVRTNARNYARKEEEAGRTGWPSWSGAGRACWPTSTGYAASWTRC